MKVRSSTEQGGILLVVMISSLVMGVTLASFLQYTATQTRSVIRSQAWNGAIPIAEAGVEEALAHINDSTIGTNFAINGWTVISNQFERGGTLNGARYVVRVTHATFPVITAVGYTTDGHLTNEYVRTVQATTTMYSTGMKGIVAKGNITMNGTTAIDSFDSEDPRYNTDGHYDPAKHKDGGYAASVHGNVYGETVYGSVGTGPTGTASGNVGDFAWLASNTGIQPGKYANDVNLAFPVVQAPWTGGASALGGSQTVTHTNFQYVSTMVTTTNIPSPAPASPVTTNYAGTNTLAYPDYPSGVPQEQITVITNWVEEHKNNPDPPAGSFVEGTFVVQQSKQKYWAITGYSYPTVTYSYSMTVTNNSPVTYTYTSVLSGDRYETTDLILTGSEKILVTGTNVQLYVTRDFRMSGSSEVILAPGASLKMWVGGEVSLSGNGLFNYTLDASKFSLYGLPTNTQISISGNASFTGVIYAPQANFELNGGGTDTYDVVGAVVANTATMNGHFQFHYDEALGRARIQSKYNVASWQEL